jgi:hypothetical protein
MAHESAGEVMAEVKNRKKWYAPLSLTERANDGFLGLIRSTGAVARHVGHGTTSGPSKATKVIKEETAAPLKPPLPAPATEFKFRWPH